MERLFPSLPGLNQYQGALSQVTQASNEVLFSVVENLLDSVQKGKPVTWTNAKLEVERHKFLEQLLRERNRFVAQHQQVLLRALRSGGVADMAAMV